MSFDEHSQHRIARSTRRHEQAQQPFYRPHWRRQRPVRPGTVGFWARITRRYFHAGNTNRPCYAYERLVDQEVEEPDPSVDGWPDLVAGESDADNLDNTELDDYWRENGAVHLNRSKYVPNGTQVWMIKGGPEGRYLFEVDETLVGLITEPTSLVYPPDQVLDRLRDAHPYGFDRVTDDAEIALDDFSTEENNRVFLRMRGGLRIGAFFAAEWHRSRYWISAVDPSVSLRSV